MAVTVRRITEGEVDVLRATRLAALRDTPEAFAASLADEEALAPEAWAERARRGAVAPDVATFLAEAEGRVVGLVVAHRDDPSADDVMLVSMWTAPEARRRGVGRQLVDAGVGFARETGATSVHLWVARGNDAALALYEAAGFRVGSDPPAIPEWWCQDEIWMTMPLG